MQNTDDRVLLGIREASRVTGLGRTKIYELLSDGTLTSIKVGKRNLVVNQSIHDWVTRLSREQAAGCHL